MLLVEVKGKKRIVDEGKEKRWGKSIFNNQKNGFPYFIYLAVIISTIISI